MSIVRAAREYAYSQHGASGQLYDGAPYATHLDAVEQLARQYQHLLAPAERDLARAGAFTHDVIEDCRVTFNDVKAALGEDVAEVAYLLATPKGRNRAERHSDAYYQEMAGNKVATFVKLCDRLANVDHSRQRGNQRMFSLYQREQAHFSRYLRPAWPALEPLWQQLDLAFQEPGRGA